MSEFLEREGKPALAYNFSPAGEGEGASWPFVMFCGGYKSDMAGSKATFLEAQCRARGQAYLRFDYSGHGESGGAFAEGMISSWKNDALDVLDHVNPDHAPIILVGSSMGGWISLLIAKERRDQIKALVGIAAAPDFSRKFDVPYITEQQAQDLKEQGYYLMPNDYDEPYTVTQALLDDGEKNCLLDNTHDLGMPIHLLQGTQDTAVPVEVAAAIRRSFGAAVSITIIEGGDHSLSRPEDLEILDAKIREFSLLGD